MVHALEEAHRALKPSGVLIDLRPGMRNRRVELDLGGAALRLGEIDSSHSHPDHLAADEALRAACAEGLFRAEHRAGFEFVTDMDSACDLREYAAGLRRSAVSEGLLRRAEELAAGEEGECVIRARREMVIARYRRLA